MPGVGTTKRRKAQEFAETIHLYERQLLGLKIQNDSSLFVVDVQGNLSKNQVKRLAKLKDGAASPENAKYSREIVKSRRDAARETPEVLDIWRDLPIDAGPSLPRNTQAFPEIRAVIPAVSGQSINPAREDWKSVMLESYARVNPERDNDQIVYESMRPLTAQLLQVFPESEILGLSVSFQIQLLNKVKQSNDVIENPEDFLARVLPTLKIENPNATEEVKAEEDDDEPKAVKKVKSYWRDGEKFFQGKTKAQRNREKRRMENELKLKAKRETKESAQIFQKLHVVQEDVLQEDRRAMVVSHRKLAARNSLKEIRKSGENPFFRVGKTKFVEPPKEVVPWASVESQTGSLRRLTVPMKNVNLRDRMTSIMRRGMIELPAPMNAEKCGKKLVKVMSKMRLRLNKFAGKR